MRLSMKLRYMFWCEGDEDVLEEGRDATDDVLIDNADDAMVSALPCFNIILFSLEINFRLSCPKFIYFMCKMACSSEGIVVCYS